MINQAKEQHTCSICLGVYYKPITLKKCKHMFCQRCIQDASDQMQIKKCPLCRSQFKLNQIIIQKQFHQQLIKLYPKQIQSKIKFYGDIKKYRIQVGNTTIKIDTQNTNKYQWTLFVKAAQGQQPLSKYASKVQVQLHPTFHPSKLSFNPSNKIQLKRIGWGTFRIDIKIYWLKQKGGGFSDFYHDLSFKPKTSREVVCKINNRSK